MYFQSIHCLSSNLIDVCRKSVCQDTLHLCTISLTAVLSAPFLHLFFSHGPLHLHSPSSNKISSYPFVLHYIGQSCILTF
jgi:hypothetical protein